MSADKITRTVAGAGGMLGSILGGTPLIGSALHGGMAAGHLITGGLEHAFGDENLGDAELADGLTHAAQAIPIFGTVAMATGLAGDMQDGIYDWLQDDD